MMYVYDSIHFTSMQVLCDTLLIGAESFRTILYFIDT